MPLNAPLSPLAQALLGFPGLAKNWANCARYQNPADVTGANGSEAVASPPSEMFPDLRLDFNHDPAASESHAQQPRPFKGP